jgi:hypothetical protein
VNDRVCQWGRSNFNLMSAHQWNSWKWKMKIQLMSSRIRQEESTEKVCYFTPKLCSYRPTIHSQLENLVPPRPNYYSSFLCSFICPFTISFIIHKLTTCMCTSILFLFCFTKWPIVCFDSYQMEIGWGKIQVLLSWFTACSLSFYLMSQ